MNDSGNVEERAALFPSCQPKRRITSHHILTEKRRATPVHQPNASPPAFAPPTLEVPKALTRMKVRMAPTGAANEKMMSLWRMLDIGRPRERRVVVNPRAVGPVGNW